MRMVDLQAGCSANACSISRTSSALSLTSAAPAMPFTCCALRTPTIAPVTAGFRKVHAMATSPGVAFWRCPMARSISTSRRFRESSGSWKFGLSLSPVVFGKSGDPFPRHRSAQQSGSHGGIDDDADMMAQSERKR